MPNLGHVKAISAGDLKTFENLILQMQEFNINLADE